VSSTIETLFQGNVQNFLDCDHILYGNIWQLIDQQFQRLSNLEQQMINYLVLENRIMSVSELFNNTKFQTTSCQIIEALESLQGRSLIEITETEVQIHSILLEYLKQKLFKN